MVLAFNLFIVLRTIDGNYYFSQFLIFSFGFYLFSDFKFSTNHQTRGAYITTLNLPTWTRPRIVRSHSHLQADMNLYKASYTALNLFMFGYIFSISPLILSKYLHLLALTSFQGHEFYKTLTQQCIIYCFDYLLQNHVPFNSKIFLCGGLFIIFFLVLFQTSFHPIRTFLIQPHQKMQVYLNQFLFHNPIKKCWHNLK